LAFTNTFGMPATTQPGNEAGFFGPSFTVSTDNTSATPEPASFLLIGAGLGALALWRRPNL
jgi:hypothetical protein